MRGLFEYSILPLARTAGSRSAAAGCGQPIALSLRHLVYRKPVPIL